MSSTLPDKLAKLNFSLRPGRDFGPVKTRAIIILRHEQTKERLDILENAYEHILPLLLPLTWDKTLDIKLILEVHNLCVQRLEEIKKLIQTRRMKTSSKMEDPILLGTTAQ